MRSKRFPIQRATALLAGAVGLGALLAALPQICAESAAADEPRPSEEEIGATQVYLTPDEAISEVFGDVTTVDLAVRAIGDEGRERLRERLGVALPADTLVVRVARDASGALLGFGVIAEEIGKYRPITFLVGVHPDLSVAGVEVLVYRESRGGEVRTARFLRQYRGKTPEDPIRINRDILNIAGATLSVRALNLGVQRVLASLEILRERGELPLE